VKLCSDSVSPRTESRCEALLGFCISRRTESRGCTYLWAHTEMGGRRRAASTSGVGSPQGLEDRVAFIMSAI